MTLLTTGDSPATSKHFLRYAPHLLLIYYLADATGRSPDSRSYIQRLFDLLTAPDTSRVA